MKEREQMGRVVGDKVREVMGARSWVLIYNDFYSNSTTI